LELPFAGILAVSCRFVATRQPRERPAIDGLASESRIGTAPGTVIHRRKTDGRGAHCLWHATLGSSPTCPGMERFLLRAAIRECALMHSARPWLLVSVNLQAALQVFLRQLAADGRSPHTIGQYRRHGTALANWLGTAGIGNDVADLTPDVLARFFASDAAKTSCRGGAKKATSANAMRTSIRCFAAHLHQSGLVPTNPARLLRRARCAPPPPRALHADEQQRLLDVLAAAAGPEAARDRMLVELLLGAGIRIGSALALDVGDIDLRHGEITLRRTKNDRPTTAILPAAVAKSLQVFLGERTAGPLFLAGDHRVSMRHMQRRLADWLAKAKVSGKSAHAFRHTFACRIYAATGDLQVTQAALGHASIASTVIYAKIDKARLRAAVGG
jgi:site-specific recombinase XerC